MSETPRYRCAAERGFLHQPTEITFAKLDYRVGIGKRAEQGDEFPYEGTPAKWTEPVNEAAALLANNGTFNFGPTREGIADEIITRGMPTYEIEFWGTATRIGREIGRPHLRAIGGVSTTEKKVWFRIYPLGTYFGVTVFRAQWRILYYLPQAPGPIAPVTKPSDT